MSPAFEAAMQTTPPMVMASAPKAGAVQPLTRKIAAVAISVAMVMPETGEADEPTMPTMRAETVTKRNPKTTISSAAASVRERADLRAGDRLELEEEEHQHDQHGAAAEDHAGRQVVFGARAAALRAILAAPFLKPWVSALTMVGSVRISVMRPAAATAPAPIGRTYVRHRSEGDICLIGTVPG